MIRSGFVDDGYWQPPGDILIVDDAASQKRRMNGVEITSGDLPQGNRGILADPLADRALRTNENEAHRAGKWQIAGNTGGLHFGHARHAFTQLAIELSLLLGSRITAGRKL